MLSRRSVHAFVIAALCLGACGTIRVSSHPDPAPPMRGYRIYGWMSRGIPVDAGQVAIAGLDTRVRAAVDANLALKGYAQRPRSVPDFLVGYRTATQFKTTESIRDVYDYRQAGGQQSAQESFGRGFEEASLTLELIDAKTRQVFWRASAAAVIGEQRGGDRVSEAVRLMLDKLPPAE